MRSGRREEENWEGCRGGRDAEPALVLLTLRHQPAPELPPVMEALLVNNEGIQLGCPPLGPPCPW